MDGRTKLHHCEQSLHQIRLNVSGVQVVCLCDRSLTTFSLERSSPTLWCSSSTVSADVTQPLHARQSCSVTLTALVSVSRRVCEKPLLPVADVGACGWSAMLPACNV